MNSVAEKIYKDYQYRIHYNADRLFAFLMLLQFCLTVFVVLVIAPKAWEGLNVHQEVHKYYAIAIGAGTNLIPAIIAYSQAGSERNKYIVTIGQILSSALLVYLTCGRVETHFHAFGSLAFLAVYRDWRVIITATVIFTTEHLMRGTYYPLEIYEALYKSSWSWLEHSAWLIFEDIFLLSSIHKSQEEMKEISSNMADTVGNKERVEKEVKRRTTDLEEFTYVLSHDLKSSIRGISTLVQWLGDDFRERLSEESEENMELLHERVGRMSGFLEAIIAYSRITQAKYKYTEIDSHSLVQEIIEEPNSNKDGRFIILNKLPKIKYHLPHLTQIFKALLNNALVHNPDKAIDVFIDYQEDHDKFIFQVSDTGKGIDSVHHSRIFKAFQILESRDKSHDIGMGLPFIKKIIEHHGGAIELISELGKGAEFKFAIPKVLLERAEDKEFMH